MRTSLIVLLASLIAPTAATANAGLTLICKGEMVQADAERSERSLWTNTFVLDLDKRQWCEAGCRATHAIVSVSPDFIDLIDETSGGVSTSSHLNRRNGAFSFLSKGVFAGSQVETGVMARCITAKGGKGSF